jgi:hypothetical protein
MLPQIVCVRRPAVSLAITRLRTKAAMAGMLLARPEGEATARQTVGVEEDRIFFFLCLGGD